MSVCIIDTSIFCELLTIPGMCSQAKVVRQQFAAHTSRRVTLLLPMTTILETGNHIGQNGDGGQRRLAAGRFVTAVIAALDGTAPWTATPFPDRDAMLAWLKEFPDYTMRNDARGKGSGLGDLTIIKEWERQRALHPRRRVFIWSLDAQLANYDTGPA